MKFYSLIPLIHIFPNLYVWNENKNPPLISWVGGSLGFPAGHYEIHYLWWNVWLKYQYLQFYTEWELKGREKRDVKKGSEAGRERKEKMQFTAVLNAHYGPFQY